MRRRPVIAMMLALGSLLLSGCAHVQAGAPAASTVAAAERFIGAWHLDSSKTASTGGGTGSGRGAGNATGGGLGMGPAPDVLVIRQGAGNLTIDQIRGATTSRLTFALDGRKTANTIGVGPGARQSVYVSAWVDGRLVTTITAPATPGSANTVTYHDLRYIDADGTLVVEISIPSRQNSRRLVYKRST